MILDQQFNPVRTIGRRGTGTGELLVPSDISFSKDGETLYVVDTYNFRIVAFNRATGAYLFDWGKPGPGSGEFIHPFGITSGKDGFVYISDDSPNRVQKFDERGNFVLTWGRWGSEPGQFYKPKGITQDDRGRIIVADFGNHRAQIMSTEGQYIDMFGIGEGYTPPASTSSGPHIAFALGGVGQVSNGGTYVVNYQVEGGVPIQLNQPFSLRVRVLEALTRTTAQGVNLLFSATMPAHFHGMTTEPRVSALPDGSFLVEGALLHMPGFWQLNFDVSKTGSSVTERAQADVKL